MLSALESGLLREVALLLGKPLLSNTFYAQLYPKSQEETGVQELVVLMWLRESKAEVLRIRPHFTPLPK